MSSEQSFWQAINENPNDVSQLGIYADWLEEQGNANAASLVRLHREMLEASEREPALRSHLSEEEECRQRCEESWYNQYVVGING